MAQEILKITVCNGGSRRTYVDINRLGNFLTKHSIVTIDFNERRYAVYRFRSGKGQWRLSHTGGCDIILNDRVLKRLNKYNIKGRA